MATRHELAPSRVLLSPLDGCFDRRSPGTSPSRFLLSGDDTWHVYWVLRVALHCPTGAPEDEVWRRWRVLRSHGRRRGTGVRLQAYLGECRVSGAGRRR
jgi:hypothetical protein